MKRLTISYLIVIVAGIALISFRNTANTPYESEYHNRLQAFRESLTELQRTVKNADSHEPKDIDKIKSGIQSSRSLLKSVDFWLRYLHPIAYRSVNGPLPVEWETEVFEKFEKPYRREGAGLTLAEMYLNEPATNIDTLLNLIRIAEQAVVKYSQDSFSDQLRSYHHFYLCNRLFLLNLATIYTTGFENPNAAQIIPELKTLVIGVGQTNEQFNSSFPEYRLPTSYLELFDKMKGFVALQTDDVNDFDHFTFIKEYVNPLFAINQRLINEYHVISRSLVDYSLNKGVTSIFDKGLYNGQNAKGVFLRVTDTAALALVEKMGKLLFYDPLLSGNNERSCASCHKPAQAFTDTTTKTAQHFNRKDQLLRNSPSLINAVSNHLLMHDGKHISLQNQTREVVTNPDEMHCDANTVVQKVLSCKEYRLAFKQLLRYTPQEKEISFDHIVSAITFYYSKFSNYYSPFDAAINNNTKIPEHVQAGFNLFMGKAQCATCHFAPIFNGVKPPYVGSEFEVIGVPADTGFKMLSSDQGRFVINEAKETRNAFRTGTIRNAALTKPYMHNGIFSSLRQVIDFYDAGGGAGRKLNVPNQTLSADSLHLTEKEKGELIAFIESLNENIPGEIPPITLPKSKVKTYNTRKPGGTY